MASEINWVIDLMQKHGIGGGVVVVILSLFVTAWKKGLVEKLLVRQAGCADENCRKEFKAAIELTGEKYEALDETITEYHQTNMVATKAVQSSVDNMAETVKGLAKNQEKINETLLVFAQEIGQLQGVKGRG